MKGRRRGDRYELSLTDREMGELVSMLRMEHDARPDRARFARLNQIYQKLGRIMGALQDARSGHPYCEAVGAGA